MMEYMKKLGIKATACKFTDLSLKDRSGGKHNVKEFTSPLVSRTTLDEGDKIVKEGGAERLNDSSSMKDDSDSSSEISSDASTAASTSAVILAQSKKSPRAPVSEYRATAFQYAVSNAFCLCQERWSTPLVSKYMTKLLWNDLTSDAQGYKMHSLAAGINYFYSSRDQGFNDKHVKEYYHLNCGTYYWSIENGQNNLLIERMRDRLLGKAEGDFKRQKPGCLACVKADLSDVDTDEVDWADINTDYVGDSKVQSNRHLGSGNVVIHYGTYCTSVEQLLDGTARVHYKQSSDSPGTVESDSEKCSQDGGSEDEGSENKKAAVFDHVIVCVHPHVAEKLVKDYQPLRSLFDDYPFRPIRAHAIVHTDQSVKCSSPTALTYEIGEDGSWNLHIDCEQYYGMKKGKGKGNIVSIFYAPDTCDSIDPQLIKQRFSAVLSKSAAHDQGTEQDVQRALRGRLSKYHQEVGSNVYLCGSYYCYEQWSQDAFAMAVEVADCVVDKFKQNRCLAESRRDILRGIELATKNESARASHSVAGTAFNAVGAAHDGAAAAAHGAAGAACAVVGATTGAACSPGTSTPASTEQGCHISTDAKKRSIISL